MVVKQIIEGRAAVENQYTRVVSPPGNRKALEVIGEVFEPRAYFEWRGLGSIPYSGLQMRQKYAAFDAERQFELPGLKIADPKACQCGEILKGVVATTLNEIALRSEVCIALEESQLPVRHEVRGACEILGLDPLYVANEGKLVAIVAAPVAEHMVAQMRQHPLGRDACIIGEVRVEPPGFVILHTAFGGTRIVDMLVGEQLPRIC